MVTAATLNQLSVSGYANAPIAGATNLFVVAAEDSYGNLVPGFTGTG